MNNKLKCTIFILLVFLSNCSRNENDRTNNDIPQNFVENISIVDEGLPNENNYNEVIVHKNEIQIDEHTVTVLNEFENGSFEETLNEINRIMLNNKMYRSDNTISRIGINIAEEIAGYFIDREPGTFSGSLDFSRTEDVSSINSIIPVAGYYIQQQARRFQGRNRAPEILILSVENENAYIREIDVVNGEIIVRNKIMLEFNGRTYVHNQTKLETINGNFQIVYLEHAPVQVWRGWFEHEAPYTFAGYLSDLMPDMVYRLTTDYLIAFTGEYIFESYKILDQKNIEVDLDFIENTVMGIEYNHEEKYLTIPVQEFPGFYDSERQGRWFWDSNFIETLTTEPFVWWFGEGVGFDEITYFFYKGGIAITHEYSGWDEFDRNLERFTRNKYFKYVVFLEKNIE